MGTDTKLVDNIFSSYQDYCENLEVEIISAIKEGIEEGSKEGIKKGILEGVSESFDPGFLNLTKTQPNKIEEIIKEVSVEHLKEQIKDTVQKDICPVVQTRLNRLCERVAEEIKEQDISADPDSIKIIKTLNISELFEEKRAELEESVIRYLPQNPVITDLFDELQNTLRECMAENISGCEQKIQDAIIDKNPG